MLLEERRRAVLAVEVSLQSYKNVLDGCGRSRLTSQLDNRASYCSAAGMRDEANYGMKMYFKAFAFFATLIALALTAHSQETTGWCRGLNQTDCQQQSTCLWIPEVIRDEKIIRRGYCRTPAKAKAPAHVPPSEEVARPATPPAPRIETPAGTVEASPQDNPCARVNMKSPQGSFECQSISRCEAIFNEAIELICVLATPSPTTSRVVPPSSAKPAPSPAVTAPATLTAAQTFCAKESNSKEACQASYRRCSWNEKATDSNRRCWPRPDPLPPSLAELPFVVWDAVSTYVGETWPRIVTFVVEQQTPIFFSAIGLGLVGFFGYRTVARRRANASSSDNIAPVEASGTGGGAIAIRAALAKVTGAAPTAPMQRDTPAALQAMALAQAYLDEIETIRNGAAEAPPAEQLNTLSLVSKQLKKAEAADPDAVFEHIDKSTGDRFRVALNDMKSLALYGEAHVRGTFLGESGKAVACLEQAITLTPLRADMHHLLGLIYTEHKHKTKAVAALEKAVALEPANMEYSKALYRAQNISGAARAIKMAAQVGGAATTTFKIGTTLFFLAVAAVFVVPILWVIFSLASAWWSSTNPRMHDAVIFVSSFVAIVVIVLIGARMGLTSAAAWFLSLFVRK